MPEIKAEKIQLRISAKTKKESFSILSIFQSTRTTGDLAHECSPQNQQVLELLKTIRTLCKHAAWSHLSTGAKYHEPDGVHYIGAYLDDMLDNPTRKKNDHAIQEAFEFVRSTSIARNNKFSFFRDPITSGLYKLFANIDSIYNNTLNTQSIAAQLTTLNQTLDLELEKKTTSKCKLFCWF